MSEQFTLKLNSPITEEQWDAITDVDFDHTEKIFFHTKHGKEVTFVKQKKGKWKEGKMQNIKTGEVRTIRDCSECGAAYFVYDTYNSVDERPKFCPNCGADMRGGSDAE